MGLQIWSDTPEGIFVQAARGLFTTLTDFNTIESKIQKRLEIHGESHSDLLVNWLRELNFLSITEELLFCQFDIESLNDTYLTASLSGESISTGKHTIDREIKAVTYHELVFEQLKAGWYARVIFDL